MSAKLSSCVSGVFRLLSHSFQVADVALVCVCRCWPTGWICPMARWAASCAAAPGRRCLQASWCVMQTYTRPPASTCCTTPSITYSWLPQSWSVLTLTLTLNMNLLILHLTLTHELFQMPHEAVSENAADLASSALTVTNNVFRMKWN